MLVKAGKPRAVSQHLASLISLPGLDRLPCALRQDGVGLSRDV